MQLQTQTRPKVISVSVIDDRIDAATAIQFKERMRDITKDGPPRVVLDLARVQFLDSSGLGAIVGGIAGGGKGAAIGAAVGAVGGTAIAAGGQEHLKVPAETRLTFNLSAAVNIQQ